MESMFFSFGFLINFNLIVHEQFSIKQEILTYFVNNDIIQTRHSSRDLALLIFLMPIAAGARLLSPEYNN